ncbi:hypothetical protein [Chondromyces apiculatus]|uniref:Uncharacterized protein n=1 Tax=Chondromyces apiculatus DSM 436 TaxID=1192034 RepID=A0A017TE46_9BACT|nr:hypothetical protein [Chondromyces apiculatus]EYF06896.1 Hypothetical protein CAP_1154 [Chondromyces apiculatus DSM 436]
MGEVWVARHAQLLSAIAVKVMDPAHAGSLLPCASRQTWQVAYIFIPLLVWT